VVKKISIIETQKECQYVKDKNTVQKLCFPGILIRYSVGQYMNQQGIYLESKVTTYTSGINFLEINNDGYIA
jgi:hypothetical protein